MATSSQSIKFSLVGALSLSLISAAVLAALISLWLFALNNSDGDVLIDEYLIRAIAFTLIQAAISTFLSVFFAIIFAKSLYQSQFKLKKYILKSLSITFVLPSLVVVIGLLSVYGGHGLIAKLCLWLNLDYKLSIYGLFGILIAHVFLNFPFATKYLYQSLALIPNEQKQLAEQLGLSYFQIFKYLEWPILYKQIMPISGLIFMLCFSSFSIVLALSGGPKYTTIEVAIYQSVNNFELNQAVLLSFFQLMFCLCLMLLLRKFEPKYYTATKKNLKPYLIKNKFGYTLAGYIFIFMALIFILLPLFSIIFDGIYYFKLSYLNNALLKSSITSLIIAFCSALLAISLALTILWSYCRLKLFNFNKLSELYMLLGSIILAVPSMVLSSGLFILLQNFTDVQGLTFILVIITNSLLALPFILKQLATPLFELTKQYHFLSKSIGLNPLNYFYLIEFKSLKRLFLYCFAFALVMSLGDFGIVALFGGQDFMTLPYYLYDQISHYHYKEASFIALMLVVIIYGVISIFEYKKDD